ncbi:hypothetical protein Zmor_022381 [Zophobas morio]|uniref:Late endosomal/lysosomal adaptor and MAPK and MTOR activator 4 n=2 Tax=Zophobas morio TaxID=2755281 RepID=A0AA38HW19_9CUCU|nr:hypothetical protein Zmor_022381 [Zophobas morio]
MDKSLKADIGLSVLWSVDQTSSQATKNCMWRETSDYKSCQERHIWERWIFRCLTSAEALTMDRIPGQTGYLLLNEEGAVLASSGDLENDEKAAVIIMGLINLTSYVDKAAFPDESFKKLSITYDKHCYVICLSNRKVHVVKKTLTSDNPVVA